MLMTPSLTIINQVPDHPFAHLSRIAQEKKAPSGPGSQPQPPQGRTRPGSAPCSLPCYKPGCVAVMETLLSSQVAYTFFPSGHVFTLWPSQWPSLHFLTNPAPPRASLSSWWNSLPAQPWLLFFPYYTSLWWQTNTPSPLLRELGDQNKSPCIKFF